MKKQRSVIFEEDVLNGIEWAAKKDRRKVNAEVNFLLEEKLKELGYEMPKKEKA